jgi:hypothetical protein
MESPGVGMTNIPLRNSSQPDLERICCDRNAIALADDHVQIRLLNLRAVRIVKVDLLRDGLGVRMPLY